MFPPHDLTHFAVETTLGYRRGFYGLVADGWNVEDFVAPWPRGPIPAEALEGELIVGCFDAERRSGARWAAADFNAHAVTFIAASRTPHSFRVPDFTDDMIARVRAARDALFARWWALGPGGDLVIEFNRA